MLNLETRIRLDASVADSPNLCNRFSSDDLKKLGGWVIEGYKRDQQSRSRWMRRSQAAMNLALQLQKTKTFPWPDAANIAFPLVTIATLQFHSRAYPALVPGVDVVRCRVNGADPDGQKKARALRVGSHMSYQAMEEDPDWEPEQDRLLINLPIVGCAFKKTYYRNSEQTLKGELVLAQDLVVDYFAKSVASAPRKTHIIPVYRNEMHERMLLGTFRDCREEAWFQAPAAPHHDYDEQGADERTGSTPSTPDELTPFSTLEQHCWVDFDKDGYAEPYIITVEEATGEVLRIVARWERPDDVLRTAQGAVYKIRATEYFTKYSFIPSPDGGIYDMGFGVLLGPLNESVNSILNQLVDAGTMANTAGGFLARGAKIRGGQKTFTPFEWKFVDSTGDDLRKSVFPLPVREPSAVLFNLLSLLINYTERISGSTDIMVGENIGQNTTKGTAELLVEQGSKIYTAIFKRIWRSMKEEFKLRYNLNALFVRETTYFGERAGVVLAEDYKGDPNTVIPTCDPNVTSDSTRVAQATMIKQSAMATPGYNVDEVERNLLRAMKVDGIDVLFPGSDKAPQGEHLKVTLKKMDLQIAQMKLQKEQREFLLELMEEQRVNSAQILNLTALATKALAEAKATGMQVNLQSLNLVLDTLKARDESQRARIELMMQGMQGSEDGEGNQPGGVPGMALSPGDVGLDGGDAPAGGGLQAAMV